MALKETMPTDGINRFHDTADSLSNISVRSKFITKDCPTRFRMFPYNKSQKRLYQREFLKHVKECFVDTTNTNTSSSVLPPKTEPRDQDNLLPPTNVIQTEEMKHEPDQRIFPL